MFHYCTTNKFNIHMYDLKKKKKKEKPTYRPLFLAHLSRSLKWAIAVA